MINFFHEQRDFVEYLEMNSNLRGQKLQPRELFKKFFLRKNHLPLILPMQPRIFSSIFVKCVDLD